MKSTSSGGILDGEHAESTFRAAVKYVNMNNLIAPETTLHYLVNSTEIIAKFESIQLGKTQYDQLGSLVLTFDLNHNFRYLVKSIFKCKVQDIV